jgi:hypothetical protein
MTAPLAPIDRAVSLLFRAIAASARNDRIGVVDARSELLALAGAAQDFEQRLVTAAVDQLLKWDTLPNATRYEIERAIEIESRRHVGNSLRLAETEPWGHA